MNTLADLRAWLAQAPPGTTLDARAVSELLAELPEVSAPPAPTAVERAPTWRERLWTAAPETRLGIAELSEALGRPRSWVYRHTSSKTTLPRLPHRKIDTELVFLVGEIRAWLAQQELVMEPAPASFGARSLHLTPRNRPRAG